MFKANLSVSDDIFSPQPSVLTLNSAEGCDIPTTPYTSSPEFVEGSEYTPLAVSSSSTNAFPDGCVDEGGRSSGVGDAESVTSDEGVESEEDVIKRLNLQNPFAPSVVSNDFSKLVKWATAETTPVSSIPETPIIPSSPIASYTVREVMDMPAEKLQTDIAAWKVKLGVQSPAVNNIVVSLSLGVSLDLKTLAMTLRNTEYNPKRFPAVIMRIREPKSTALLFKSGKMVVVGTKSLKESHVAARKFGRALKKVGYPEAKCQELKVHNIASTFVVPFQIDLVHLSMDLPSQFYAQFEPEVFPGLVFKFKTGTLLIFKSGKCVMVGMKSQDAMDRAFLYTLPHLDSHRMKK